MQQDQRILETTWRIQANLTHALDQAAEIQAEPDPGPRHVDLELDYHAHLDRGLDIDRGGPSLGI